MTSIAKKYVSLCLCGFSRQHNLGTWVWGIVFPCTPFCSHDEAQTAL